LREEVRLQSPHTLRKTLQRQPSDVMQRLPNGLRMGALARAKAPSMKDLTGKGLFLRSPPGKSLPNGAAWSSMRDLTGRKLPSPPGKSEVTPIIKDLMLNNTDRAAAQKLREEIRLQSPRTLRKTLRRQPSEVMQRLPNGLRLGALTRAKAPSMKDLTGKGLLPRSPARKSLDNSTTWTSMRNLTGKRLPSPPGKSEVSPIIKTLKRTPRRASSLSSPNEQPSNTTSTPQEQEQERKKAERHKSGIFAPHERKGVVEHRSATAQRAPRRAASLSSISPNTTITPQEQVQERKKAKRQKSGIFAPHERKGVVAHHSASGSCLAVAGNKKKADTFVPKPRPQLLRMVDQIPSGLLFEPKGSDELSICSTITSSSASAESNHSEDVFLLTKSSRRNSYHSCLPRKSSHSNQEPWEVRERARVNANSNGSALPSMPLRRSTFQDEENDNDETSFGEDSISLQEYPAAAAPRPRLNSQDSISRFEPTISSGVGADLLPSTASGGGGHGSLIRPPRPLAAWELQDRERSGLPSIPKRRSTVHEEDTKEEVNASPAPAARPRLHLHESHFETSTTEKGEDGPTDCPKRWSSAEETAERVRASHVAMNPKSKSALPPSTFVVIMSSPVSFKRTWLPTIDAGFSPAVSYSMNSPGPLLQRPTRRASLPTNNAILSPTLSYSPYTPCTMTTTPGSLLQRPSLRTFLSTNDAGVSPRLPFSPYSACTMTTTPGMLRQRQSLRKLLSTKDAGVSPSPPFSPYSACTMTTTPGTLRRRRKLMAASPQSSPPWRKLQISPATFFHEVNGVPSDKETSAAATADWQSHAQAKGTIKNDSPKRSPAAAGTWQSRAQAKTKQRRSEAAEECSQSTVSRDLPSGTLRSLGSSYSSLHTVSSVDSDLL
jgi:hypothetical protein